MTPQASWQVKDRSSSFPRRRESRPANTDVGFSHWILAFARMTIPPARASLLGKVSP